MKPFIRDALVLLDTTGLNPTNPNRIRTYAASLVLIVIFLLSTLDLILNWKGKLSIVGFNDVLAMCQNNPKFLLLAFQYKTFGALLNEMDEFWSPDKFGATIEKDIKNAYSFMKTLLKYFKLTYTGLVASYVAKPFLTGSRTLLLPCYLFSMDIHASPTYEILYIFQTLYASMACTFQLGFDILFWVFILHTVCELRLTKGGLALITFDELSPTEDKKRLMEFEQLALHHSKILDFIKKLNELYSIMFLNQLLTSTFVVCGCLLILSADGFTSSAGEVVTYIMYLITLMGQLFINCLAGNLIADESESVADVVYNTEWWIRTHVKLRKRIVLIILRSHKVSKLTAGGVFDLDLQCYTDIVKTGMSFFTLMRTVYSTEG